jgi:hypothetical protein
MDAHSLSAAGKGNQFPPRFLGKAHHRSAPTRLIAGRPWRRKTNHRPGTRISSHGRRLRFAMKGENNACKLSRLNRSRNFLRFSQHIPQINGSLHKKSDVGGVSDADLTQLHNQSCSSSVFAVGDRSHKEVCAKPYQWHRFDGVWPDAPPARRDDSTAAGPPPRSILTQSPRWNTFAAGNRRAPRAAILASWKSLPDAKAPPICNGVT